MQSLRNVAGSSKTTSGMGQEDTPTNWVKVWNEYIADRKKPKKKNGRGKQKITVSKLNSEEKMADSTQKPNNSANVKNRKSLYNTMSQSKIEPVNNGALHGPNRKTADHTIKPNAKNQQRPNFYKKPYWIHKKPHFASNNAKKAHWNKMRNMYLDLVDNPLVKVLSCSVGDTVADVESPAHALGNVEVYEQKCSDNTAIKANNISEPNWSFLRNLHIDFVRVPIDGCLKKSYNKLSCNGYKKANIGQQIFYPSAMHLQDECNKGANDGSNNAENHKRQFLKKRQVYPPKESLRLYRNTVANDLVEFIQRNDTTSNEAVFNSRKQRSKFSAHSKGPNNTNQLPNGAAEPQGTNSNKNFQNKSKGIIAHPRGKQYNVKKHSTPQTLKSSRIVVDWTQMWNLYNDFVYKPLNDSFNNKENNEPDAGIQLSNSVETANKAEPHNTSSKLDWNFLQNLYMDFIRMPKVLSPVVANILQHKHFVAMDCEMVGIRKKGRYDMIARVSIVNRQGEVLLDKFVKPCEQVVNYRSEVPGIRPEDIENGEDFKQIQKEVAKILKGKIIVGHSIRHDLKVLGINHPIMDMRDTSRCWPLSRLAKRGTTPGLKFLCKAVLDLEIQTGEHDTVEDARAVMCIYNQTANTWEEYLLKRTKKQQHG